MKPSKTRRFKLVVALVAAVCAIVAWQYFTRWGSTKALYDAAGTKVAGSVAEMRRLELGGVEQSITIRGRSTSAPVLIWLHAGPGQDETGMLRRHNSILEDHFLVVYWTQRGTGRSFNANIPASSMTISQFVSDLDALITYVRQRFGQQKVVLAGHSWGTSFGVAYTQKHSQKVAAFVGIGQVVNAAAGETLSYNFTLKEAQKRQNDQAVRELTALGPPPYPMTSILKQRAWLEKFGGGSFHKPTSLISLLWQSFSASEVTLLDGVHYLEGGSFSNNALEKENSKVDWWSNATQFDMPVFIVTGRYDNNTPASLQTAWYRRIVAPLKQQRWFENSAHSPLFEEAKAFNQFMIADVLPVAKAWRSDDD